MADQVEPPGSQVKLRFITQQSDIALPENTPPILVNTNLRRYALSTLINHLLETEKPIPFEFLVNGSFLRTSIDEYLTSNGISAETLLTLEYVRAIIPPTFVGSFTHDEWVSSVDVLSRTSRSGLWTGTAVPMTGEERILSGSYDGRIRIWNMSSQVIAISPSSGGHTAPIKATKFLSANKVVSAGMDRSIRVWQYDDGQAASIETTTDLTPELELYGHKKPVNSIDIHTPSSRILSASADQVVGIWSIDKDGVPVAPQGLIPQASSKDSKRRKVSSQIPQRGPLDQMKGHTGSVSEVIFAPNDHTVAYSVSQDHTFRTWDLPTASLVDTRTTSHPLFSIEALVDLNLIAVGTSARHITLIDPRASATTVSAMTLRGHSNFVVSLSKDPENSYGLLSGSHDGTCRIWDLRSARSGNEGTVGDSVYTISRDWLKPGEKRVGGEGVKVLTTAWDKTVGILSAGEDKKVQINRGSNTLPMG